MAGATGLVGLRWTGRRLEVLRLGGSLHDVGKISVEATVLRKPGPLTEEEFGQIRRHPVAGRGSSSASTTSWSPCRPCSITTSVGTAPATRTRLEGDSIPLEARVLGVADAFDAMTSVRPYRPALSVAAALAELERCAGSQFDPWLAYTFVDRWERGEIAPGHRARRRRDP